MYTYHLENKAKRIRIQLLLWLSDRSNTNLGSNRVESNITIWIDEHFDSNEFISHFECTNISFAIHTYTSHYIKYQIPGLLGSKNYKIHNNLQ